MVSKVNKDFLNFVKQKKSKSKKVISPEEEEYSQSDEQEASTIHPTGETKEDVYIYNVIVY
jgi:hypothetical protein